MRYARFLLVAATTLAMAIPLAAELPSGMELIAKFFEASGGKTNLEAIRSRVEQRGGLYDIDLIFESVEFNVDIPASQFEMPDEIKAMME